MKWLLVVVALLLLAALWWVIGVLRMRGRATPIHQDDPWLHQAMQQARDSFDAMRQLQAQGGQVAIKFPLTNTAGDVEHVWGALQGVDVDSLKVVIMTPLFVGPTPEGVVDVAHSALEDWQSFLPDGRIRGGYTTQAQIAVCRREGFSIPRALLQQEPRFIDRIDFHPSPASP
jgi:hypothetical protein